MSNKPLETWSTLLAERRLALGTNEATNVDSEDTFRGGFRRLCEDHKERDSDRLLSRLLNQYDNVTSYAESIDRALDLQGETLTSIFWISLLSTIASAFRNHVRLRTLVELLDDHDMPDFGVDVTKFVDNASVQTPLQNIFKEFIDCYLMIIERFSAHETLQSDDFNSIEARLIQADNKIQDYEQEWIDNMAVAQEEEEEERRRRASVSTASFPNGLNGDKLYPMGTNISFEYVRHLGRGTCGEVAALKEVLTGELYARKLIHCANDLHAREREIDVRKEVNAMNSLRHHHIASVRVWTKDPEHYTFSIFMWPVGDGHLGDYLSGSYADLNFDKRYDQWFGCLISALHHAHVRGIIHQDIKPSNIIIKDYQPYLADFGTAKDFSKMDSSVSVEDTIKGTPNYLAPEDRPGEERGRATDIFSLGCVFAEMLTVRQGRVLEDFRSCRRIQDQTYQYVFRDNLSKVQEWLLNLTCSGIAEFIRKQTLNMLQEKSAARPEAKELRRSFRGEDLVCNSC